MGEVVTFYSFKGGVGRSMALANVAAICAQRGRRAIALDFDFEAPGLHRYFLSPREEGEPARHTPIEPRQGVLNYFRAVFDELMRRFPDGAGFDTREVQEQLPSLLGTLLDAGDYLYEVQIQDPNRTQTAPVPVHFIPAARFDDTYPDLVRSFDWQQFYDLYSEVFPALARELSRRYDYVLIDSRTGVTDIGSICTMLLPEKLVLAFTPNEQSLRGALDAGWQAIQGRKQMPRRQTLQIYPLLSRVEEGEEKLKRMWISRARQGFERLFREAYGLAACDLETYFNAIRVPHRGYYAYGERIAAEEQRTSETGSLAEIYHELLECLDERGVEAAQENIRKGGFGAEEEMLRALAGLSQSGPLRGAFRLPPFAAMARLLRAEKDARQGRIETAIRACDEIIAQMKESTDTLSQVALAMALGRKADLLHKQERRREALDLAQEIIQRFSSSPDATLQTEVTRAYHNVGYLSSELGDYASALIAFEQAIQRLSQQASPEARIGRARALEAKAEALMSLGKTTEGIALFDDVIQGFGSFVGHGLERVVIGAKLNKAAALVRLDRSDEARLLREEIIGHFRDNMDPEIRPLVGAALLSQSSELESRLPEQLAVIEDAILRLEGSEEPRMVANLARGLLLKGMVLQQLGRKPESLAVYDAIIERYGASGVPEIQERVATALYLKGTAFHESGRLVEAHATMSDVESRWGHVGVPALRKQVMHALGARIQWFRESKEWDDYFATCDHFLQKFQKDDDDEILLQICQVSIDKSSVLVDQERYSEAAVSANTAHAYSSASRNPEVRNLMPQALCMAGVALFLEAKQTWKTGNEEAARALLEDASEKIEEARVLEPEHALILENAAYVAFLLGRKDETRALLQKALTIDHAKVRDGALKDAATHPLPQDEAFRTLVLDLADGA